MRNLSSKSLHLILRNGCGFFFDEIENIDDQNVFNQLVGFDNP